MNRSWVRFPQAAQIRPPGSGWAFLYALLVAPTDLRPPRGLPARSPSAPRASLGASARSPARPRRPRGGLQSVGVSVCCPARPCHRPPAPQPGPPVPLAPFTPVGPGVLLCLLAPHPACIRYKVRPAWLVAGGSGRKFAMRAQNAPKWAFSGEQGEFCTARGVRRGPQGEFCTGSGVVPVVLGEFYLAVAPPLFPAAGISSPAAPRRGQVI